MNMNAIPFLLLRYFGVSFVEFSVWLVHVLSSSMSPSQLGCILRFFLNLCSCSVRFATQHDVLLCM